MSKTKNTPFILYLCDYTQFDPFSFSLCVFSLRREGYTMQVNVNDYLDIYCPHYNDSQRMVGTGEQYILYMVSYRGYRNCDPQMGFKRWECNRPHAPHAPIKFSEKFQRYSAFSLGYEFHVGQEYYYICEWNQSSNQYHIHTYHYQVLVCPQISANTALLIIVKACCSCRRLVRLEQ